MTKPRLGVALNALLSEALPVLKKELAYGLQWRRRQRQAASLQNADRQQGGRLRLAQVQQGRQGEGRLSNLSLPEVAGKPMKASAYGETRVEVGRCSVCLYMTASLVGRTQRRPAALWVWTAARGELSPSRAFNSWTVHPDGAPCSSGKGSGLGRVQSQSCLQEPQRVPGWPLCSLEKRQTVRAELSPFPAFTSGIVHPDRASCSLGKASASGRATQ